MESDGKSVSASLPQVQPPERRVLQSTVVEIEAVNVEVGDHSLLASQRQRPAPGDGLDPIAEEIGVVTKKLPTAGGGCQ